MNTNDYEQLDESTEKFSKSLNPGAKRYLFAFTTIIPVVLVTGFTVVIFVYSLVVSYTFSSGLHHYSNVPNIWISIVSFFLGGSLLIDWFVFFRDKFASVLERRVFRFYFSVKFLFIIVCTLCSCISYATINRWEIAVFVFLFWGFWCIFSLGILVSDRVFFVFQRISKYFERREGVFTRFHSRTSAERKLKKRVLVSLNCTLNAFNCVLTFAVLLITLLFTYQAVNLSLDGGLYKPIGEFYEINAKSNVRYEYFRNVPFEHVEDGGSWKMLIHCVGPKNTSIPTIVFEVGNGASTISMEAMQDILTKNLSGTRICVSDRAGYGFSQQGLNPRSLGQRVAELRQLLKKANEDGSKLVFAGHSMGGTIARFFAYKYPDLVAGIILLDSTPDHYFDYYSSGGRNSRVSVASVDAVRWFSSLGLVRWFINNEGDSQFHPRAKARQNAQLINSNELWNMQYMEYMTGLNYGGGDDGVMDNAKQDCAEQVQCFGEMPMWYVKAGFGRFNKTCAEMGYPEKSQACKDLRLDNRNWVHFIDDFRNQTKDFDFRLMQDSRHEFVNQEPELVADVVREFYLYVLSKQ